MSWADNLKQIRLAVVTVVAIAGIVAVYSTYYDGCGKVDNSHFPNSGNVVNVEKPISNTSNTLPEPRESHRERITVVVRDTISARDTVGAVHVHEVTLYTNVNPGTPPQVYGSPAEVSWAQIREPFFDFGLHVQLGISSGLSYPLSLSPFAGMSVLTLGRLVDLGWGIDGNGTGPVCSVTLLKAQKIGVFVMPALWQFRDGPTLRAGVSIEF